MPPGPTFPSSPEQEAIIDGIALHVRDMTVGFMKISQHAGEEDAEPAGTGTLVYVDSTFGILTASHVLAGLPDEGKVGLVRFRNKPDDFQTAKIDMEQAEKLSIGGPPFGPLGPDVGFLRLPEDLAGALRSTNVFYNAAKRQEEMLTSPKSKPYFDAVIGVLAEQTTVLAPLRPNTLRKGIEARIWLGNVVKEHEAHDLDLLDFEILFDEGVQPPISYEGVSGGALWRVRLGPDYRSVVDKRIVGLAFYQSEPVRGRRILSCHGPRSIYGALLEKLRRDLP